LVSKLSHFSPAVIWGALHAGKKAPLVIWNKYNWGSINAGTYCNNILYPALFPFWLQESQQVGRPCLLMEDGAPGHRVAYSAAHQDKLHLTQHKIPWACILTRPQPHRKCLVPAEERHCYSETSAYKGSRHHPGSEGRVRSDY